jgi:hypothetical protein
MESAGRHYDAIPHQAVVSNLLDLQARLRGDPASMVIPKVGRPSIPDPVAIAHDDVVVTETPIAEFVGDAVGDPTDLLVADTLDAEDRIEALRRRLQYLELEIDAYESAVSTEQTQEPARIPEGNVIDLQQAVERRLTHD